MNKATIDDHAHWLDLCAGNEPSAQDAERLHNIAVLLRALSAEQAQPVAVKPLEWSEVIGRDDQYFKGISAPGYRIDWHGYGEGEGPYKLDKHGEFDTLEAAKAAAQSDYEARIRSALVPQGADK